MLVSDSKDIEEKEDNEIKDLQYSLYLFPREEFKKTTDSLTNWRM